MGRTEVFDEGARAYTDGLSRESCPYGPGTPKADVWKEGWDEAQSLHEEEETKDDFDAYRS